MTVTPEQQQRVDAFRTELWQAIVNEDVPDLDNVIEIARRFFMIKRKPVDSDLCMTLRDLKRHIDNLYLILERRDALDAEVLLVDELTFCHAIESIELSKNEHDEPLVLINAPTAEGVE